MADSESPGPGGNNNNAMRGFLLSLTEQMKEEKKAQRKRDDDRDAIMRDLIAQLAEAKKTKHTVTTTVTEKRTLSSIPQLTDEKDLEVWDTQVRASLAPDDLFRYLEKDVPEPEDKTTDEWRQWKMDRQDIYKLLTASIRKATIISRMTRIGWKPDDVDPRKMYMKAFEALQHGTEETARRLTNQFFTMTPKQFDSMDAYVTRVCTIRQRLRTAGLKHPLKTDIYTVLTAIKDAYPEVFERGMRKLEKDDLEWDDFIKELTERCVDKDINKMANATVKVKAPTQAQGTTQTTTAPAANAGAKSNKPNGDTDKINCDVCTKLVNKNLVHCLDCNGHKPRNAEVCWTCNPEQAPDTFKYKAERMKKKAEAAASSTTGPLRQNSGVSNPSTSAQRSNFFLSTNFMTMRPQADFH
jgi:hypothetical protein